MTGERPPEHGKDFIPHPGPQTRFISATWIKEILYGGAAGGGKTAGLAAIPLRWVQHGNFRALILRRETTQLDGIIGETQKWYRHTGQRAYFNNNKYTWRFDSGARVRLNHCKDENDKFDYQGLEFHVIEFDELTTFTESQYEEITSRCRSTDPNLPTIVRATSNPGGTGHDWVFKKWGPWLDPDFEAEGLTPRRAPDGRKLPPLAPGEVAYILRTRSDDGEVNEIYVDVIEYKRRRAIYAEQQAAGIPIQSRIALALTRTFIPASLSDNPTLAENDPEYYNRLLALDPVRREQLMSGNWLVKPGRGLYFKREWFEIVDEAPKKAHRVRYWDRASSEGEKPPDGKKPPIRDWTAGVRVARAGDVYYVEHNIRRQENPGTVKLLIKQAAIADATQGCMTLLELDPGQAGVFEASQYAEDLQGLPFGFVRPTGDKVTRARGSSAIACPIPGQRFGRVKLVRGPWNNQFLDELEAFPESVNDDDVDGFSGAVGVLSGLSTVIGHESSRPNDADASIFDAPADFSDA